MDWMPTLLAAAAAAPDPAYPIGRHQPAADAHRRSAVRPRTAVLALQGATRSARCATATMKFLKILDNTFLFNVVDDPMERANLKDRQKDVYDRLVAEWLEWNADDAARSQ